MDIRTIIERMRERGRTVFVNSHLLGEVEQVADEVAILARGRVLRQGPTHELTRSGRAFAVRCAGPVPFELRERFEAAGMTVAGDRIEHACEDVAEVQEVIDALRAANVVVREVGEVKSTREEVFLSVIGEDGES